MFLNFVDKSMRTVSIAIALALFYSNFCVITNEISPQTVKLRIGNPYDQGIFISRSSSLNPRQLISVEYLPPKGQSRYFNGSLDVYVVPTDLVGLWPTKLDDKASDQQINVARGKAVAAFAKGKFNVWRIKQIKQGLTKVFLTIKELDRNTLTLVPNGPIQDGSVPEITFLHFK